jgi:hypothetical protein
MNTKIKVFFVIILINLIFLLLLSNWYFQLSRNLSNAKGNLYTLKPKEIKLETRVYGYTDITDLFYSFPSAKVAGLKRNQENLTVDLELKDIDNNFDEFVKYLWQKENFVGVTSLTANQKDSKENCIFMKLEFMINN